MSDFGRYRLLKRLGAGGMGEVFLAAPEGGDELVVVKRILPHLVENPRFLRLFLDETRIASRLVHPNIVRIFELGEAAGTWYVAMEHVPGKDLREIVKRVREQGDVIPVNVALHIAAEVAKALEYAHSAQDAQGRSLRIVHRDVSPHNILTSERGEVKLIDFGVAKAANKAVHTASGFLKGKFPYMAPEQASAAPVDARTDVFALGIVLWELLCGRGLFRGKNDVQTIKLVRACAVAAPSEHRPGLPEGCDRIVLKALRREAKDRFQSAGALQEALEALLADLPRVDLAGWLRRYADVPGLDGPLEAPPPKPRPAGDGAPRRPSAAGGPSDSRSTSARIEDALQSSAPGPAEDNDEFASPDRASTNLPPQPTAFVGRVAELADLHQLFRQGVQLITLLGAGGTGKSRLASQFAQQLVTHFRSAGADGRTRGGVWHVDLADVRELDGLYAVLGRVLGVQLVQGDPAVQLSHALAGRGETLVLLDGFERIASAGAVAVARWMKAAPSARFVVTTRELLRVPNETVFEVLPLRTPVGPAEIDGSEAVRLFVERARAFRPDWSPSPRERECVAEIVRQLDGLPLAIELAAARMLVLGPEELLQRLPRRFDALVGSTGTGVRQLALRDAVDWSWESLSSVERAGLAQLSVFVGGFTSSAVEAVLRFDDAGTDGRRPLSSPIEVLLSLRSKSLVRAYFPHGDDGQTRFGLYETIREYALERLRATASAEAAFDRHAEFTLELGESLASSAEGSARALDALDLERENLNAVFARALAVPVRGRDAARAVLALDPLLTLRGPFNLHLPMLEAALKANESSAELRALLLEARGRALQARGRLVEARKDFVASLALAHALKDSGLAGRVEFYLGNVERREGRRSHARRRLSRALRLQRATGDRRMQGRTLSNLAVLLHELGREDQAVDAYRRALEIHRAVGDRRYEGVTLANRGVQQQALGLLKQARGNYRAALAIHRELGNRRSEGISHINLGDLCRDLGQPGQAAAHYARALHILREAGARRYEGVALSSHASLHQEEGRLREARGLYGEALNVFGEVGEKQYEGLALAGLAAIDAMEGRLVEAEASLELAARLLTQYGEVGAVDALDVYRAHVELASAALARSREARDAHLDRYEALLDRAERAGPPDDAHPSGLPSPADRSEHVRAALRSLQHAHQRLFGEQAAERAP